MNNYLEYPNYTSRDRERESIKRALISKIDGCEI
jgi:hypothetical protein